MKSLRKFLNRLILVFLITLLPSWLPAHEGEGKTGNKPTADASEKPHHSLDQGDVAPLFVLTNQDRQKIAFSDFSGRPRFVVFIYTHCEDVCPLILQNRKQLEKDMEPSIGSGVVFLAITFDPENDTPEVLKAFIKEIGVETKDLHLLTGETQEVEKVLLAYEIGLVIDKATGRVTGHSAVGFAIDRNGIIREVFNFSS